MPSTRSLLPRVRLIGAPMSSGVELRQLLEILLDEVGELEQQVLPLERLDLAPRPFEGAASGGDRAVDVLRVALGDRRQQFAGGGIVGLEALAGGGVDPLAVDQHLLVGPVGERMARDRNSLRHSHGCTPLSYCDRCFWKDCYLRGFTILAWFRKLSARRSPMRSWRGHRAASSIVSSLARLEPPTLRRVRSAARAGSRSRR